MTWLWTNCWWLSCSDGEINVSTYLGLKISHLVFAGTQPLFIALQGKDTTVQEATIAADLAINYLERQRTDKKISLWGCTWEFKGSHSSILFASSQGDLMKQVQLAMSLFQLKLQVLDLLINELKIPAEEGYACSSSYWEAAIRCCQW